MTPLRYTLLADGPSDRCLLRIIDWLLGSLPNASPPAIAAQFADPRLLPNRPSTLSGRMLQAVECYPCSILFVHRDAEREPFENRMREIELAADEAKIRHRVPVIPVRMTEAWLLLEIGAIRTAADNPNGNRSRAKVAKSSRKRGFSAGQAQISLYSRSVASKIACILRVFDP